MIIVGLTGSIGMGKSTTAEMFRDQNVPVYDADAAVHGLYANELVAPLNELFPGVADSGVVDRVELSAFVVGNEDNMKKLEAVVHPAVRQKQLDFIDTARRNGEKLVLLDIPLLFETAGEHNVDKVVVVTAPPDVQRARVLAREGMTDKKFAAILKRQVPDAEKRARADFLIDTSQGLDAARSRVAEIIAELTSE